MLKFCRRGAPLFLVSGFLCLQCARDFDSHDYFPLHDGYRWHYTGVMSAMSVQEESVAGEKQYIAIFSDSLGNVKWKERYIKTGQNVGWIALEPQPPLPVLLQFKEAIPLGPISDKVGAERHVLAQECSAGQSPRAMKISYRVADLETITVPAGTFTMAIKQTMRIEYPDEGKEAPISENVYWFVRQVGIVKFSWDGIGGELQSAQLGERNLP
jgi:hypothetical protein